MAKNYYGGLKTNYYWLRDYKKAYLPSLESRIIRAETIAKMLDGRASIIDVNTIDLIADKPMSYKASP